MNPTFLLPAWHVVLQYALSSKKDLSASFVSDIIARQENITEEYAEKLADLFGTSKEYWINLQKQWDDVNSIVETDQPCPDISIEFEHQSEALVSVISTSGISKVKFTPFGNEFKQQNIYFMSEQAYKYMLAKCTKDEMWDLGFLGQSEKHVKKSELSNLKFNKKLDHGAFISDDYSQGILDLESMNKNPKKYATHCLIADHSCLVIQSTETCRQLLFINNSWQPSDIYYKLLKPLI